MTFYQLIVDCAVAPDQRTIKKLIMAHKDNEDVKELFRLMLDKSIVYNIKSVPPYSQESKQVNITTNKIMVRNIHNMLERDLRGDALKRFIIQLSALCSDELKEVLKWILDRQNPAKIGKTIVNTIWPGLIRVQEYMGAVPGTEEALAKLPWETGVSVQHKIDGMTLLVHYNDLEPLELRTRAGQNITRYFPKFLSKQTQPMVGFIGIVHHEGLVWDSQNNVYLDRQTGNGLINKVVKNGLSDPLGGIVDDSIHSVILDLKNDGNPNASQDYRYEMLPYFTHETADIVNQTMFYDIEEARKYAKILIRDGMEGVICKDPSKPFKNGKPTYNVKIKHDFTVELECIGRKVHSKNSDKTGSLLMATRDRKLEVYVGSGLSDFHRSVDHRVYLGLTIEVTAESIIESKGKKKPSLYLPRFITDKNQTLPIRYDKDFADSYAEVQQQEIASKSTIM